MAVQRYCPKCQKTLAETNFFTRKNGTKTDFCKLCQTMFVKNDDPETFKWILQDIDIPWLPNEWRATISKEKTKNPNADFSGGSLIMGRYIAKMKLNQHHEYGYADSEMLQEKARKKAEEQGTSDEQLAEKVANMEKAYENGEISKEQLMTYKSMFEKPEVRAEAEFINDNGVITTAGPGGANPYPVNDNPYEQIDIPDVGADLSDEDKVYLAVKWGRLYTAADWVYMEKRYNEYEQSFDLHNVDLVSGTIQLCKLDLKCNQALDSNDTDTYSKFSRAADALRKSLKFTEAQRKEAKEEDFGCYGLIVSFCEENTNIENSGYDYIPMIDLGVDRDIVDKDLHDIKNYNEMLIKDDPAVYKMIEEYIKKRENLAAQEEAEAGGEVEEITDDDLIEYSSFKERESEMDNLDEEDDF